jgi:hypothetical protein
MSSIRGASNRAQPAVLALCLLAFIVVSRTVPDVDLWGHVKFGHDILTSGLVPATDPYSFTSDKPWINHEWFWEVMLAWTYQTFGPTGLISLRWSIIALLLVLVWSHLRRNDIPLNTAASLLALVALLTYPRMQHIRPQLFSILAFAGLLTSLKRAEEGRTWLLYTTPLLMVLWGNVHGGWIFGFGVFILWASVKTTDRNSRRLGLLAATIATVGALATLLNPYGIRIWQFLSETVRLSRNDIVEWQSLPRAGFGVMTLWLATAVLAGRAMWRFKFSNRADAVLVFVLGVMSFRVSRLDAFFALAAVMLFGERLFNAPPIEPAVAAHTSGRPVYRHLAIGLVTLVVLGLAVWRLAPRQFDCIDLRNADWLPEPEAIDFAQTHHLRGNMLTYFDWGEYAIWHLSPAIKVSMDGRRETVYSSGQITGHLMAYAGSTDGIAYVERIDPDFAWLPKESPLVDALKRQGWGERFIGPRSVVLSRMAEGAPVMATSTSQAGRCFPGP